MSNERVERREDPDEAELIVAARNGDHRAFGTLVTRYQNRLFRFIVERVGNREDAEDILQVTFVNAYRALPGYRSEYRFSTWLFTLAYRRTVDRMRKRRDLPLEAATEDVTEKHPASVMESEELSERLWDLARRVLSERQHALLWLRYGEDLDLPEVAAVTGLSRAHVKVLLFRARKALERHLTSLADETRTVPRLGSVDATEGAWLRNPMIKKS